MLVPPTSVDRHAVLPERAHDAEVREPARASAGEHEADCPPGQQPNDPPEVLRSAHVVMPDSRERRLPARGRAVLDAGLVQQQEFRAAHAAVPPQRVGPGGVAARAARRQQHDIGLAQAQPRPGRIAGIGRVHDEVILRFAFVEPARAMGPGALLPHDFNAAKSRESGYQPAGVHMHVEPRVERNQGDRARNDVVRVLAYAVHEAIYAEAGEPQDRFRMSEQDALEASPQTASRARSRAVPAPSRCAPARR